MNRSELIEDYPDYKYGPSCLILGFTHAGQPIHVQCSYPNRLLIKSITGTVEHIQALIKSRKKPDKAIETPVYEYMKR